MNSSETETLIQFDTPEAAERAAWMLRGRCINQTQVAVPKFNANRETLSAVAASVGSKWQWVSGRDVNRDDQDQPNVRSNQTESPTRKQVTSRFDINHLTRSWILGLALGAVAFSTAIILCGSDFQLISKTYLGNIKPQEVIGLGALLGGVSALIATVSDADN